MLKLFKISGNSLYPHFKDGQRVLCSKVFSFTKIKKSDVVVFSHMRYGLMIKIVEKIEGGQYFVQGTDALSIDSRTFGLLHKSQITHKLIF